MTLNAKIMVNKKTTAKADEKTAASGAAGMKMKCSAKTAARLAYAVGFVCLFVFFGFIYGDVIMRAQQESYVCTDRTAMHHLLGQPLGELFWLGRFALLSCHWALLGGLCLSAVLTLAAFLFDHALGLHLHARGGMWRGVGFLPAVALIAWMLSRGTNLYYKSEPSLFLLLALGILLAAAVVAGLAAAVHRFGKAKEGESTANVRLFPLGTMLTLLLLAGSMLAAVRFNENVILTARLQRLQWEGDWQTMIEEARKAQRPSRAVAAYHAIALEETDGLLEGIFDLVYDFPDIKFDKKDGNEEYGLFVADCNYHAGLLNAGYRKAMDHVVMNGPCLYYLKRMAVCAVANEEWELAKRYLAFIGRMPLESDFVEKYAAIVENPKLAAEDAELAHVKLLYPQESKFEQQYRQPAFLGYNIGLMMGSDATLYTSIAACLYSKDLQAVLPRAYQLVRKGLNLPPAVQQAIVIAAQKNPEILTQFPGVSQFVPQQLTSFLLSARPYSKDRKALRRELKKDWLGTYMYYYYCENNEPDQVRKADEGGAHKSGVN